MKSQILGIIAFTFWFWLWPAVEQDDGTLPLPHDEESADFAETAPV
jgi:hypothetical protein